METGGEHGLPISGTILLMKDVSIEDWDRAEEETLYVLQNKSLMEQIERSLETHQEGTGYRPSPEELAWLPPSRS